METGQLLSLGSSPFPLTTLEIEDGEGLEDTGVAITKPMASSRAVSAANLLDLLIKKPPEDPTKKDEQETTGTKSGA